MLGILYLKSGYTTAKDVIRPLNQFIKMTSKSVN